MLTCRLICAIIHHRNKHREQSDGQDQKQSNPRNRNDRIQSRLRRLWLRRSSLTPDRPCSAAEQRRSRYGQQPASSLLCLQYSNQGQHWYATHEATPSRIRLQEVGTGTSRISSRNQRYSRQKSGCGVNVTPDEKSTRHLRFYLTYWAQGAIIRTT